MHTKLRDKYWKIGFLLWVLTSCKPEFNLVPRALFTGLGKPGKSALGTRLAWMVKYSHKISQHSCCKGAVINYWGGGSVLFQRLEPKNVSPSQVNSPKILAPFKMWAQKIVTLPCEKLLIFLRTLFWDNYFTGIRKKCYYFNTLFTKPNGSPSKGNPYIKQPRCYSLNSCFVVNFKSEQIVRI